MLQGKRTRRIIALTFLVIMLTNTIAPSMAYALTSGPTQPEVTSFEPIDTTDMVSLQTGDFTYNIPLIEVPGPEGGYPLSLSYHAGIQPNEDASWVGLGWTLNPGAINRSVNGFPDDWYNPYSTNRVYWAGGVTSTWNVGVSVGIAGLAGVNFGLSFSQDTYRGFGAGFSIGLGVGIPNSSLGASIGVNASDYGGTGYLKGGISLSKGFASDLNGSVGLNFTTNFESLSAGMSSSFGPLDVSMSTGANKPSLGVGGLSASVTSSKEASIQTSTSGWGITIPLPGISIFFGRSKTRYWTDEKTNVNTHGSLYSSGWTVADNRAYDTYSLLEDPENKNIVDYPDPTKVQGGAYMDFDLYNVNAQGLGGNIRPYLFQGEALGQNRKDQSNNPITNYYSPGPTHATPEFRFAGDFSNSYRQNYPTYSNPNQDMKNTTPPFDGSPVYGDNDGSYGFYNNKLAGSRHINVGVTIQPSNIYGYTKTDRYKSYMIEGFSITNESGVTYHYALPAYSYGEEIYQEKIKRIDPNNVEAFNRQTKSEPYAYTWYLTTITGPDFVDRDGDGKAGNNDWGYWINFEYGKWSNSYIWRTPSEGYNNDDDHQWKDCSMGKKEVYYLNAIRTRSHVALFEKDLRKDGKGSSSEVFNKNSGKDYANAGGFGIRSSQSMLLSKIYLINTSDGNIVNPYDGGSNPHSGYETPYDCSDCQLSQNVLDWSDVETLGRSSLEAKSIRVIDFVYDYSLCPGTANSFPLYSPYEKWGKLTLKQLNMRGKGGVSLLPPTKFEYDLSGADVTATVNVPYASNYFESTSNIFNVGDMVRRNDDGSYCGVIIDKTFSGGIYKYYYLNAAISPGSNISMSITKNPPYHKEFFDHWGMYKNDISTGSAYSNPNAARRTSERSARGVDAWSLRKIISPLGGEIKIEYEGDSYSKSVLNIEKSITGSPSMVGQYSSTTQDLSFYVDLFSLAGNKIGDVYKIGDTVNFITLQPATVTAFPYNTLYRVRDSRTFGKPVIVVGIDNNNLKVTVHCDNFNDKLYTDKSGFYDASSVSISQSYTYNFGIPRGCNLFVANKTKNIFGGGIRVKSLISKESDNNKVSIIKYDYSLDYNPSLSSGVTSSEPVGLDITPFEYSSGMSHDIVYRNYMKTLHSEVHNLYSIAREIPPPGVTYEYVTVTNEVKNVEESENRQIEGKTQYQFETYRENMVVRNIVDTLAGNYSSTPQSIRNIALKKFTNSVGNIKRITQIDSYGRKISETINNYLHDGLENQPGPDFMSQYKSRLSQFKYQGYLQERMTEVKQVQNSGSSNGVKATLSAREEYPCVQTGQTIINYVNGTQVKSENLEFDFYSGAITKTVETDAYGNRFMTETVPAYRKYSSMGLKISTSGNKNMLTQNTGTYVYKVNSSNTKLGLISAQVQTWSNTIPALDKEGVAYTQNNAGTTGDVWRMQSSYSWMPVNVPSDGLTAINDFSDFNWTTPGSSNANWKKTFDVNLYDVYSKGLQGTDINGINSATRMTYASQKVELSGANANYYEMAFSSVEDNAINQAKTFIVKKGDGIVASDTAHTGNKSLRLGVSGKKGLLYSIGTDSLVSGRTYVASVWTKPISGTSTGLKLFYDIDGTVKANSATSTSTANGWTLLTLTINGSDITPGKKLTVGCRNDDASIQNYVDDLRFQPLTGATTAYVYDSFAGELTYVLDNNNLYTAYEYDAAGRLVKTYKEKLGVGKIKTSESQYNMNQPLYVAPPAIPYAKFTYDFAYTDAVSCEKTHYFDVYIKFYSDPACTTPVNVSNLTLNYYSDVYNIPNTSGDSYNSPVGSTPTNQYYVGQFPMIYQNFCGSGFGNTQFYLTPGDYHIKPSDTPTPPMLYAKMVKTFAYTDYNGCQMEDYYYVTAEFFWDYACTNPAYVTYMGVPYWYDGNYSSWSVQGTPLHSVYIGFFPLHILDYCYSDEYDVQCELGYSSEFTIVY